MRLSAYNSRLTELIINKDDFSEAASRSYFRKEHRCVTNLALFCALVQNCKIKQNCCDKQDTSAKTPCNKMDNCGVASSNHTRIVVYK